jgi:hypothetical protein
MKKKTRNFQDQSSLSKEYFWCPSNGHVTLTPSENSSKSKIDTTTGKTVSKLVKIQSLRNIEDIMNF